MLFPLFVHRYFISGPKWDIWHFIYFTIMKSSVTIVFCKPAGWAKRDRVSIQQTEEAKALSTFNSTKNSENFEIRTGGIIIIIITFPGKLPENPEFPKRLNFQKANHSTENSGDSWRKSNGTAIPVWSFWKFGYTSGSSSRFRKFWKTLFHLSLEISGNLNRNFLSIGKCPLCHVFRKS